MYTHRKSNMKKILIQNKLQAIKVKLILVYF